MKLAVPGLMLTGAVTLLLWVAWGTPAVVPGVVFGGLATLVQVVALELLRPMVGATFSKFMARWGMGMGLRLLGVVLFAAAVVANRTLFPPLPTALAYVGVLLPLLFMEIRWLR